MKKTISLIIFIFFILIFIKPAYAGVGIVYGVRDVEVYEGDTKCITYGIYNPFDSDVTALIFASGELSNLISKSDQFFVPAHTSHDDAKKVEFCFKIPKDVYERDCLIGNFFCDKSCSNDLKVFRGSIVVQEVKEVKQGTGSGTASSASASLNLIVKCLPQKRNYFALSGLIAALLIFLAIIGFIIWMRMPSYQRLKEIQYQHALNKLNKLKKGLHEKAHHTAKHTKTNVKKRRKK